MTPNDVRRRPPARPRPAPDPEVLALAVLGTCLLAALLLAFVWLGGYLA